MRVHGRVAAYDAAAQTLTLDALDASLDTTLAWTAHAVLADGSVGEAGVASITKADNALVLEDALSPAPLVHALAVLEAPELEPRLWRVISVAERDGLEFAFTARAYRPDKYAAVEDGAAVSIPSYSFFPTGALAAPTTVALEEYLYRDGVAVKAALTVAAEGGGDARVRFVDYQLKGPGGGPWRPAVYSSARTVDLKDMRVGVYQAQARFVDGTGALKSPWTQSGAFTAQGKTAAPSTPANPRVTVRADTGFVIAIDAIADLDRDHYSYWVGDSFEAARLLARVQSTEYLWTTAAAGAHTFWIAAHDTSDHINGGSQPVSLSHTIRAPGQPAVSLSYEGGHMVLTWTEAQTDFRIAAYEIAYGGTTLAEVTATTWRRRITWASSRSLTLRARDRRQPGRGRKRDRDASAAGAAPGQRAHHRQYSTVQL